MPLLNEDTCELMRLIRQNDTLHDDCVRIAEHTLENHPPADATRQGFGRIASVARDELAKTLQSVVLYAGDPEIREHLTRARVDWRDVAREFLAGVLSS